MLTPYEYHHSDCYVSQFMLQQMFRLPSLLNRYQLQFVMNVLVITKRWTIVLCNPIQHSVLRSVLGRMPN